MRRDHTVKACLRVSHLITHVAGGYIDPDVDTSMEGDWWQIRQELWERIGEARASARGFKGAKLVRTRLNDLLTRLGAADSALLIDGKRLPKIAALDLADVHITEGITPETASLVDGFNEWRERWGFERYQDPPPTT